MRVRYDDDAIDERQLARTIGIYEATRWQSLKREKHSDLPAVRFEEIIGWLKGKGRHQSAAPTVQEVIEAIRQWDYSAAEREQIAKTIKHLQTVKDAIEPTLSHLRTYARNYLITLVPKKARLERRKHWDNAHRLAEDLNAELRWLAQNEPPPSSALEKARLELLSTRVHTRSRIVNDANIIDDGFPSASPKTYYQFRVLGHWRTLGGQVRFSRHPDTAKIGGPLSRFYNAATWPVIGGSPESLNHAVNSCKQLKASVDEWCLRMAIANGVAEP